jgi:hypothetical protein
MHSLFRKELKLRSNNKLKSRDLKRLRGDVLKAFPRLTDTLVDALFPSQSSVHLLRYEGRVAVYMCAENPLFFEAYDTVFPSSMNSTIYSATLLIRINAIMFTYSHPCPFSFSLLFGNESFDACSLHPWNDSKRSPRCCCVPSSEQIRSKRGW